MMELIDVCIFFFFAHTLNHKHDESEVARNNLDYFNLYLKY